MGRPIVIICIDGFDPEYLEAAGMPNLREIGRKGFLTTGRSMMPSVTNVNNVSLVTASYPADHGICSNYRWDRETGEGDYLEAAENIRSQTMFRRADRTGDDVDRGHGQGQAADARGRRRHDVGLVRAGARMDRRRGGRPAGDLLARGERLGDRRRQLPDEGAARRHRLPDDHRLRDAHEPARPPGRHPAHDHPR